MSPSYYCMIVDLYMEQETGAVHVLFYYEHDNERKKGFVVATLSPDTGSTDGSDTHSYQLEEQYYYLQEGTAYEQYTFPYGLVAYESMLTPDAIYFNGWPGVYRYDLVTGELAVWEEQWFSMRERAGDYYQNVISQMAPIAYTDGYILVRFLFGMMDEEPTDIAYAIYNEAGELQNFAVGY